MQYFKLPKSTIAQIDKIQRDFILGSTFARKKMHYLCWKEVTKPKHQGGLGIPTASKKNKVMLANLSWKIFSKPSSLRDQCLIKNFSHIPHSINNSFIWKNVLVGWNLCSKGIHWIPTLGNFINVENFNWIHPTSSL